MSTGIYSRCGAVAFILGRIEQIILTAHAAALNKLLHLQNNITVFWQ